MLNASICPDPTRALLPAIMPTGMENDQIRDGEGKALPLRLCLVLILSVCSHAYGVSRGFRRKPT